MNQLVCVFFISCSTVLYSMEYVSLDCVKPGQLRYTQANVASKAKRLGRTARRFDNGKSSIDKSGALPVIKSVVGFILVDGHHHFLAAKQMRDKTVPVRCIADLSDLTIAELYHYAFKNNYIYPVTLQGQMVDVPTSGWFEWEDMQDDPNRLFASLTALKCAKDSSGKIIAFRDPNAAADPQYPLWVKRTWNKIENAFIEFKIADALYRAGLTYAYSMGTNPNDPLLAAFIEKARKALFDNPIQVLELLYPRKLFKEICL